MREQNEQQIFALDIGTRSLIGIVGHKEGDLFCVQAYEELYHPKRAMIDGQIEDINQVARVAQELKQRLEEKLGTGLKRVAVAAAGRALKTSRGMHKMALSGKAVDAQLAYELESAAVNEAREALSLNEDESQYHCVGHSVVRAAIDGYTFSNLLQHKGREAEVEVIATFLPGEVVSSLRRCMDLVGLEIETLTLEPIAAMRAVLPKDIRLLNLAMVDIGAGTSDIAITKDGTVAGYTMATVAGDEITEAVIRHCLVDFETAEQVKLAVASEETVSFTDILGHTQTLACEGILQAIEPGVEMLAKVIADQIEECNESAPAAVFLVGGGSQTPGLCRKLAEKLGLEANKVAVAGTKFSGRLLNEDAGLDLPEHATPVGIALLAAEEMAAGGSLVQVNGKNVRLFIGGEGISVMDVLLLAGYRHGDLMGHNGRSVVFWVNEERKVAFGTPHSVAQITLNGQEAGLTQPVYGGDILELGVAQNGEDARPIVADYLPNEPRFSVFLNNQEYLVGSAALLNGVPVHEQQEISDQAKLILTQIETVQELCDVLNIDVQTHSIWCKGAPMDPAQKLAPDDVLRVQTMEETVWEEPPAKSEVAAGEAREPHREESPKAAGEVQEPSREEAPKVAGKAQEPHREESPKAAGEVQVPHREEAPKAAGKAQEPHREEAPKAAGERELPGSSLRVQLNGRTVELPPKADKSAHTLLDLLPLMDIDPQNPKGWAQIQKNGRDAGYLETLAVADVVEIVWKEQKTT